MQEQARHHNLGAFSWLHTKRFLLELTSNQVQNLLTELLAVLLPSLPRPNYTDRLQRYIKWDACVSFWLLCLIACFVKTVFEVVFA
mmetsp:Transcript_4259/g.9352  ORF Transcript_4259/g.9352 Transcript_4259/m.9352 type:complete len:86 (+) Transcript_4259:188-445(+)